jgi:hypothetical protein
MREKSTKITSIYTPALCSGLLPCDSVCSLVTPFGGHERCPKLTGLCAGIDARTPTPKSYPPLFSRHRVRERRSVTSRVVWSVR